MELNKYVQFDEGLQNRVVEEGAALWNDQGKTEKQAQKNLTMHDYQWPWGRKPKPRGLKNLRLEEMFPYKDFLEGKKCVSPLVWGRPGGGAPIISHTGQRWVRTKEHPIIRFQWNNDLRRCVDNSLRYKKSKEEQELYKKQLDAQVTERRRREKWEKENDVMFHKRAFLKTPPWGKPGPGGTIWRPPKNIGLNFLKSLGWSTEKTLKKLSSNSDTNNYGNNIVSEYEKFKCVVGSNAEQQGKIHDYGKANQKLSDYDRYLNARIEEALNKKRLSPLKKEIKGEELVPILAKQRAFPLKVPLGTTDVTRGNSEPRRLKASEYLRELTNQMDSKRQTLKDTKTYDVDRVRRHFQSLDDYWGRPGNGAPRSTIKKGCLDRLLHGAAVCAH